MLRVFATIVLPLVLPTAIYLFWVGFAHGAPPAEEPRWAAMPWVWLVGAGALLLGFVLFVVTVGFGTSQPGTYVPPRWENGRIIPGHIEQNHP
jgi:hypothetical protein